MKMFSHFFNIANLFLPGYKGDEMMFTDEQRKRGVSPNIRLWKENGKVRVPYVIHPSSKEISLLRDPWVLREA